MRHNFFKWLLLIVLCFYCLAPGAQTTCTKAATIPIDNTCLTNEISTSLEMWNTFTAVASQVEINLTNLPGDETSITSLSLYGGTCDAPVLLASANPDMGGDILLYYDALTVSLQYFLVAEKATTLQADYTICAENAMVPCKTTSTINGVTFPACPANVPPPVVCKGDSVHIYPFVQLGTMNVCTTVSTWTIIITPGNMTYSIPDGSTLSILAPDDTTNCEQDYNVQCIPFCANGDTACTNTKLCPYFRVVCPPIASISINPTPICLGDTITFISDTNQVYLSQVEWHYWYLDGILIGSSFIDTQIVVPSFNNPSFLTAGQHNISLVMTNGGCTDSTGLDFWVNNPDPCFTWTGDCKVRFENGDCNQGVSWQDWDFGDGSPHSNFSNPIHQYPLDGQSYTVTHTIVTLDGDTLKCTEDVIQPGGPDASITGYGTNNCGSGFLTYTAPCVPGTTYTWTVAGGTGTVSANGCQNDITWSNSGGQLVLTAWDSISDCVSYDTLVIPACCFDPSAIPISNRTATSVLNDPVYAPYISGTNFTTNTLVIINGVFTIDTTFTFLNCTNISFGANALTYINPGEILTYDNTDVIGKCDTMWDGNHISNVTATLKIINGSNIQQAIRCVYSISGGNFVVDNSTLRNNYRDILVTAYGGTHPGTVTRTLFTQDAPFLPAIPALPFGHTRTICAIEIEDNADITIGDGTSAILMNNFTNILVGVRSKNSRTVVQNCRFANFVPTVLELFVPDAGTGVVAIGQKNLFYQPSITVGGPLLELCVFVNMRTAVNAMDVLHVNVENNNISNISIYGVKVLNCGSRNISIIDNTITNQAVTFGFNTAILVAECYDATVNINLNRIMQTTNTASGYSFQTGVGIQVSCVSPGDVALNILSNNSINRVRTGIWLLNLIGTDKVFVNDNVINFTKPNSNYTSVHYGIRLENCATVRLDTNRVNKGSSLPVAAMVSSLRGISIENSPMTVATDNVFTRLGSGLYGMFNSDSSTLACNKMDKCYTGVFFDPLFGGCIIGDQIIDPFGTPSATGNTWNANVGPCEIDGVVHPAQPIVWRWEITQPVNCAGNVTCNATTQTSYNACDAMFFLPPGDGEPADTKASAIPSGHPIEKKSSVVDGIYSATWAQGIRVLTPADSALLLNVALQDPVTAGGAVISARLMLGLEIDYSGEITQSNAGQEQMAEMNSSFLLYPNPASKTVNLEWTISEDQNAYMQIFDLSGKIILTQQLAPNQEFYIIDVAALPGGVYMVRVVVNQEPTETQRLVIVK